MQLAYIARRFAVFLLIVGLLSYLYIVVAGQQAIQLMQMQGGQAQHAGHFIVG